MMTYKRGGGGGSVGGALTFAMTRLAHTPVGPSLPLEFFNIYALTAHHLFLSCTLELVRLNNSTVHCVT